MQVIYKYNVPYAEKSQIALPLGAKILHVSGQAGTGDNIWIWAQVDPDAPIVRRDFILIGTGHQFSVDTEGVTMNYIGTASPDGFSQWHLYEVI